MFRKRRIFNIKFIFESNFTKFYNHFMIINHEFFTFEQYFDFTIFFETQKILYSSQQQTFKSFHDYQSRNVKNDNFFTKFYNHLMIINHEIFTFMSFNIIKKNVKIV